MKTVGCVVQIGVRSVDDHYISHWYKGTAYNYGIGKPHYPVPAKLTDPCDVVIGIWGHQWFDAQHPSPQCTAIWTHGPLKYNIDTF